MEKKCYEKVISHTIKTEGILHALMIQKTLLNQVDWNKPFRLTVEYEPEMLNSHITVETD